MRALCLGLALLLAAPVAAEERPDVETIISRQLDAFAHDDAPAAFDFAAQAIRDKFRDPAAFLAMVRSAYPPVYRHRSVQFGPQAREGDEIRQGVVFIDADNAVWNGVYLLAKQADGAWKIQGCALRRSAETSL
jgi:hypothetical protein